MIPQSWCNRLYKYQTSWRLTGRVILEVCLKYIYVPGNSGNQAFTAMPRQLGEFLNIFYKPLILGNCRATKKISLKN